MNAPTTPAAVAPADGTVVARAPLSHFAPSATNRKHSADYIEELGISIARLDVIQPITARPWPASRGPAPSGVLYEIVIGEGRWLGSKAAAKTDIPFFWRELSDEQALELQLIENLKRKDLTAIEEAEGYRRLMKDHGHSADTVAERIGRSRAYVYGRLKLLDLGIAAREAFAAGQLDASTALLVARIPGEALQKKAIKEITEGYGGEPLSYRSAKDHIHNRFTVSLKQATFPLDDADLVAAAGPCAACPRRSGNVPEICADLADADVCLDTKCFEDKRLARRAQLVARAEKLKVPVITGTDAWQAYHDEARVGLDEVVEGDGQERTYRQILGDQTPKPVAMAEVGHGSRQRIVELADATAMQKALQKAGWTPDMFKESPKIDPQEAKRRRAEEEARQAEREAREQACEADNAWRQRLRTGIAARLKAGGNAGDFSINTDQVITALAVAWLRRETDLTYELPAALLADWGITPTDDDDLNAQAESVCTAIARWPAGTAMAFLFTALTDHEEKIYPHAYDAEKSRPRAMLAMANAIGFDADSLREPASTPSQAAQAQEVSAPEIKPATKAKKPASKKTKAKGEETAPASPANEPAAPVKPPTDLRPAEAWPFPQGNRP